jgi:hypothetical protein
MMQVNADHLAQCGRAEARVLVVADWTVDPQAVVAACAEREGAASFILTVPARLHGLDWVGDPTANVPCAQRQLETISRLSVAAGLEMEVAGVGDPDPTSAITDVLHVRPATEILLLARRPRFWASHPWDLAHRAQRLTGLPVRRIPVPAARDPRGRHGRALLGGGGRCDAQALQVA